LKTDKVQSGLRSLESVLRETATLSGNIQEQPYLGSVFSALNRLNLVSCDWHMPRAKKDHQCSTCDCIISNGEEYVKWNNGQDEYTYEKFCISCASRYLLNVCEAYRYGAPSLGYVCYSYWSEKDQEWINLQKDEDGESHWKPVEKIPDELSKSLVEVICTIYRQTLEQKIPGFDISIHKPWVLSLLQTASDVSSSIDEEKLWAINQAIDLAHSEGISRWIKYRNSNRAGQTLYCSGCGNELPDEPFYLLYGEITDFMCIRCTAISLLTERTKWILDYQESLKLFWESSNHNYGLSLEAIKNSYINEQGKYLKQLEYQLKIDHGFSIEEIANQEDRRPSTIIRYFKGLGIHYNKKMRKI
jgi:hypothetical protein